MQQQIYCNLWYLNYTSNILINKFVLNGCIFIRIALMNAKVDIFAFEYSN